MMVLLFLFIFLAFYIISKLLFFTKQIIPYFVLLWSKNKSMTAYKKIIVTGGAGFIGSNFAH